MLDNILHFLSNFSAFPFNDVLQANDEHVVIASEQTTRIHFSVKMAAIRSCSNHLTPEKVDTRIVDIGLKG
jgi:hypothetical protein